MFRSVILTACLALILSLGRADAADKPAATLFKNPQCSCCEQYAEYLRRNGYDVKVVATHDLSLIKRQYGIAEKIEGCHTTLIDRYVIEGHVPVKTIDKLLAEKPEIKGISLPGMPAGSPGMTGRKTEPFTIYEIGAGDEANRRVYATE